MHTCSNVIIPGEDFTFMSRVQHQETEPTGRGGEEMAVPTMSVDGGSSLSRADGIVDRECKSYQRLWVSLPEPHPCQSHFSNALTSSFYPVSSNDKNKLEVFRDYRDEVR